MKLAIFLFTIAASHATFANEFLIEGSDLMMGVGAQGIGIAGANTARVKDASAMYWNPANLTQVALPSFIINGQINQGIEHLNLLAYSQKIAWFERFGIDAAFGLAYIKRLHVKASGHFKEDELETLFLDFTLPNIGDEITGDIESKTRDFRFAFAIAKDRLSIGTSISYINCQTFSCGMKNQTEDVVVASALARSIGLNLALSYRFNENLKAAINVKDINSKLDVRIEMVEPESEVMYMHTNLPTDIFAGLHWQITPSQSLSTDFQWLFGQYAIYKLKVQTLRIGYEYQPNNWTYRTGTVIPIAMNFEKIGDLMADLPAPFAPTLGLSYHRSKWQFDAALYPHPLLSYSRNEIVAIVEAGMSYHF